MRGDASLLAIGGPGGFPKRRFVDRGRQTIAAAVGLGLLGTLIIGLPTPIKFAYRSDAAHVAIETAAFLVPTLAAILFVGRTLRAQSRTDLLLALSLGLLAATNLFFSLIPALVDEEPGPFATWAPVVGRLLGAAGFAAAALVADGRLAQPRRTVIRSFLGLAGLIALIAVVTAVFADDLPRGVDPNLSPETADRSRIVGHWLVLTVQMIALFLYAAATVGFLRRSERERDALLLWVSLSAALSSVARLNYFLFPSLYSEWVYVGDVLRLAAYIALLVGVSRELLAYQRRASDAAVFEERRRLARELHDGLAQELAFIRSEGARLSGTSDPSVMRMATAAERALGEARMAISALTTPVDEPLDATIRRAAEGVAGRMDAEVEVTCVGKPQLATAGRQAIERIVREAVGNAVRHGQAKRVRVDIEADESLRVAVTDDGRGFDQTRKPRADAFGIVSMRERAQALGGEFSITSRPGEGCTVEVVVPNQMPEPARGWRR
jgi:signal transduction histidine kinase